MTLDHILVAASALLLLSIVVSKLSSRLGVPVLLLFLALGMLAGSDGPGGIYFDNARIAQALGVVALALILFAGGLETEPKRIRPVVWQGVSLATLGVAITAFLVGWFVHVAFGFSWREGLLLGVIVSSTDAAAVFAVLRSSGVNLRGNLESLLEFESGSNDPMAVFLTIAMIELISQPDTPVVSLIPMFFLQMGVGAAFGYGAGKLMTFAINRLRLQYDGLYPVFTLSATLFTYAAAAALGGSGFLAVYLAAIIFGSSDFIHKKSLIRFHDGLAWLMQIAMFLTLGLLVFPHRLVPIIGIGLLTSLFLIFIARPASVFASLLFARLGSKDKLLISWVGLRGAVPIILATFPMVAGLPGAETYFNIVFFIVLTSGLLQGTTISVVARWLGVEAAARPERKAPLVYEPDGAARNDLLEIIVPPNSPVVGRRVLELGLPEGTLIALLVRDDEVAAPGGGTVIEAGDLLLVFAHRDDQRVVEQLLAGSQA